MPPCSLPYPAFKIMRGHCKSSLMWYRTMVGNLNVDDQTQAQDPKLNQPVLLLTSQPGPLNLPGAADMMSVKECGHEGALDIVGGEG
ncbi:hypothetical protein BDDG_06039 [Blastomyces dermatitidis ATCC 18188]|uniref:Uncharacterized protein n=1 Tax=Ajellomyces dermatitidis (strain ATCC 18188 / CBS 674.68) TaxID=653446 RepID=F2TIN2_AJEDA|nr:hypothetical protein BDDG_06039 [Blastomyces dermatitidis ATCC 18188]EQL31157.1 hypothetical protein BDFG_06468 [Blastomyces dermatitidis ATCC 26199]